MNNPLVSIIIPTYNRAHLIHETLDSVLAQTYTNWECIVLDDRSTDNTEEVLKIYVGKDARFQYHKRPTNRKKGANACRNYGFELSKGDYINWFDSDDLMKPNKLDKQLALINKTALDYVISQTEVLDTITGIKRFWNDNLLSDSPLDDYIQYKVSWSTGSILFKKDFLKMNDLKFDEVLAQSQEYDFFVKVLHSSINYDVDLMVLNINVWHNNSISFSLNNFFIKSKSSLMVRKRILFNKELNLKKETKVFLIREILRIFSKSIESNNMKAIRESCFTLIPSLIIAPIRVVYKIKCIVYATLTFSSYTFTGRGYYFYKKIKI
jgi:glycosyltransferase involved in cell wall biosynthesis